MSQDEAVRAMHIVSLFLLSSKTRCRGIDVESLLAALLPPCLPHTTPPFLRRFRLVNVSSLLAARNENRFVLLFFFVSRVSLLSSLTSSSTRLHELTLALSSRIAYSNHNTCPLSIGLHLWANFADCRYRINYLSYLWLKSLRSYSCLGCLPYFISYSYFYALPVIPSLLSHATCLHLGLSRTAACLLDVHQTRRDAKRVLFICLPNALAC